jgi:hypothetical protein
MSQHQSAAALRQTATITDAPARTRVDRTFGLPNGLYAATVGLYLAFLAVMTAAFGESGLAIPMVIMMGFVVIAFGLAGKWAGMQPRNDSAPLTWGQFSVRGIQTHTGQLSATEASIQVLVLPVLILGWGLTVAAIAASVR